MKIISVEIKNFRSIINQKIELNDMNVFVGLNDSGKSNFLRALNLFFNNETDSNTNFNFSLDYSNMAPVIKKKAKEIQISLRVSIPDNYHVPAGFDRVVVWKKTWRSQSNLPYSDTIKYTNNSEIQSKSRIPNVLREMQYKYIPAVKDDNFFSSLLYELYKSFIEVFNTEIQGATKQYSDVVVQNTAEISKKVFEILGISSELKMPVNQGEIFKSLFFETTQGDNTVPLNSRGDGIKTMHIPAILNFIATNTKGSHARQVRKTIWGYEEPENGLEMIKAYDLSDELYAFSNNIQILITSHSPAFYRFIDKEDTLVYNVSKTTGTDKTEISLSSKERDISEDLGLMPFVENYITEFRKEILAIKEENLTDVDTIIVEGKSDKAYIEFIIKKISPNLNERLTNNSLKIFTRDGNGGCQAVVNSLFSWKLLNNKQKAFGILDNDCAGRKAHRSFKEAHQSNRTKCILLPLNEFGKKLAQYTEHNFEIERLVPISFWQTVPNLLEDRKSAYRNRLRDCFHDDTKSDLEILKEKIDDELILEYINKQVKDHKKNTFFRKFILEANKNEKLLDDFTPLIEELEKFFIS